MAGEQQAGWEGMFQSSAHTAYFTRQLCNCEDALRLHGMLANPSQFDAVSALVRITGSGEFQVAVEYMHRFGDSALRERMSALEKGVEALEKSAVLAPNEILRKAGLGYLIQTLK